MGEHVANKKVCIIGGGIAGVGLWWTLAQAGELLDDWDITVIHDGAAFGGHALTVPVTWNGGQTLVDTGVQFYVPFFYPNIDCLVSRPEIAPTVPTAPYDRLKVACGFPRLAGAQQNWGNFPAYQSGPGFGMYTQQMQNDALRFQQFVNDAIPLGWGSKTIADYFNSLAIKYENQSDFLSYFLYPYLSIINGYGAALDTVVTWDDLVPLFTSLPGFPHLGSFTKPGSGYARFLKGASSLVDTMAAQAQKLKPASLQMRSSVVSVAASPTLPGPVTVVWSTPLSPVTTTAQFDKVVITTDILVAAGLLNNQNNSTLWSSLYSKYLAKGTGPGQWNLLPGKCYIHTDASMLSPDLQQQQETLQFTAYYAPQTAPPFYDMFYTYTTYLEGNIHNTPESQGLYLTMYGYIPDPAQGQRVPDPSKVLFEEVWQHGMWLPSFMWDAKRNLHMAQGKGVNLSYPGQIDTGIYFAGNNTTADSLEHAFISGAVIANYAFGADYPLTGLDVKSLAAFAMYEAFYTEFMFPGSSPAAKPSRLHQLLPRRA